MDVLRNVYSPEFGIVPEAAPISSADQRVSVSALRIFGTRAERFSSEENDHIGQLYSLHGSSASLPECSNAVQERELIRSHPG